jgi:hypothetical protein
MSEPKNKAASDPTPTLIQQVIYCGPTLPRQYGLPQYRVFIGGIPAHLAEVIAICPAINALIVPVGDYAKTKIAIATKGTPQATLYAQIVKQFTPAPTPKPVKRAVRR